MPGIDGIEVCRRISKIKNVPILMLSAKSQDMDKILGLTTGADDYLTKPFNPLELIARVKSQLRRYIFLNPQNYEPQGKELVIQELVINPETHTVQVSGNNVNLTPTEFDILLLLAGNRGRVFSSEEIFERVWGEKCYESDNTVVVHIRKIREKLEENPRKPVYIKTVWGVGYKIEK
jgi:DNA-binding response OmpR family regulator